MEQPRVNHSVNDGLKAPSNHHPTFFFLTFSILFIFHSFIVLVKIMVIINKYKMEVDDKITPGLP